MQRAEKLELARAAIEASATAEDAPATSQAQVPRWYVTALAGVLVLVAAGISTAAFRFSQQIQGMEQTSLARSDSLAAQVAELANRSLALEDEVLALRTAVAVTSSEDVLFLKTIILRPGIDPNFARTVARLVHRYSAQYAKDPNLVLAIISVESNFDPKAVSDVGATGLMQVMPHWKNVLGISEDLSDPEVSIRSGLQVLGFYQQMYRDPEMVLAAYNRGPGPVDHDLMHGKNPRNAYASKVLAEFDRIRRLNVGTP
jgi:soluble lytic murein transglycosylase-like protein